MDVSEDGTVTGSIDRLALWGVVANTTEAQDQLDRLKGALGEGGWQTIPPHQDPADEDETAGKEH